MRRTIPIVVVGAFLLVACGGGDSNEAEEPIVVAETDDEAEPADTPGAAGAGQVDLVGPDVVPAAEIETNLLPSVVLDDVSRGMKVNFRNLVPQDKPILLWAYAPH